MRVLEVNLDCDCCGGDVVVEPRPDVLFQYRPDVWEHLPTYPLAVCRQCGAVYLSQEEALALDAWFARMSECS